MSNIEGSNLLLRSICEDDTDLILRWRNSDHVRRNFVRQESLTREEHEQWLHNKIADKKAIQFIMIIKETGRPIGSVYLRDINMEEQSAEYGVFIGEKDALGKGYGSEVLGLMIDYSFRVLKIKHLLLRVLEHNSSAIHIYEKYGFRRDMNRNDEAIVGGNRIRVLFYQKDFSEE